MEDTYRRAESGITVSLLTVAGVAVAVFVGFNIGGSSTGVTVGPAVGSRLVREATAGVLFVGFGFLGAWTAAGTSSRRWAVSCR
ncbi:hypothetical protein GCM10009021_22340 [Halarchaeum nitratireducens]|uniref:Phosphate transporter n=1 Tax=Halarchaeum nitratireducens TaxID=489913 RepID=A0A830GDZ2_9EURY|nr:hypothetical protein GCM10009021_22340 [Halarchaeum nitratireducens]